MDINELVEQIKTEIGLVGTMAGIYDDAVIKHSILEISLPEFNRWSGFLIDFRIDGVLHNFKEQFLANNGTDLVISLPDYLLDDFESLGAEVKRVYFKRIPQYPTSGYYYSRGMIDDMPIYQAQQQLRNNYQEPHFSFKAPRTIIAHDYGRYSFRTYTAWLARFEMTHSRNLSTISIGLESSFKDLCKYDLMINLFNNELRFLNADIGSAQITADTLENFRNAEQDRRDLIERLRKKNAIDHIDFIF